ATPSFSADRVTSAWPAGMLATPRPAGPRGPCSRNRDPPVRLARPAPQDPQATTAATERRVQLAPPDRQAPQVRPVRAKCLSPSSRMQSLRLLNMSGCRVALPLGVLTSHIAPSRVLWRQDALLMRCMSRRHPHRILP